jgi:hypothetical protein
MILAGAALLVGLWFVAVAPQRERAAAAGRALSQAQSTRDSAVAQERTAVAAESGFNGNVAAIASLQKALPAGDDVSGLLHALEVSGDQQGAKVRSITASTGSGPGASAPTSTGSATQSANPATGPATTAHAAVAQANAAGQAAGNTTPGTSTAGSTPGMTSAAVTAGSFPSQTYTLSVDGGFLQVQKLLDTAYHWASVNRGVVAVGGRLLSIQSVSIKDGSASSSAQTPGGAPEAAITVTVYTLPSSQATPAALLAQLPHSATSLIPGGTTPTSSSGTSAATGSRAPVSAVVGVPR